MELIKINTDEQGRKLLSARELYKFLEYEESQFNRWAQKYILKNELAIEGADYERFDTIVDMPNNAKKSSYDFAITVDFAKRLSMLARTEKGEQIRNYFLECEKKAAQPQKQLSAKELAMLVIKAEEEKEQAAAKLELANKTIQLQAPKVQYVNDVLSSESTHAITTIAKELGISGKELNKWLKEMGVQYIMDGHWVLTAKYQSRNYTKTRTHTYYDSEGAKKSSIQTVWTETGRAFIHWLWKEKKKTA